MHVTLTQPIAYSACNYYPSLDPGVQIWFLAFQNSFKMNFFLMETLPKKATQLISIVEWPHLSINSVFCCTLVFLTEESHWICVWMVCLGINTCRIQVQNQNVSAEQLKEVQNCYNFLRSILASPTIFVHYQIRENLQGVILLLASYGCSHKSMTIRISEMTSAGWKKLFSYF